MQQLIIRVTGLGLWAIVVFAGVDAVAWAGDPPARASSSPTGVVLAVGSFVTNMFLFPTDNKLTKGDSDTISALKGKALALGNANINCHIHADPELDYLFPKGTVGVNGNRNVVVV